jgi:hypothetical protein
VGIAGVAQELDNDVFNAADIVLGLATLGFRDLETHETVSEVLFHFEEGVAGDGGDEVEKFIW